LLDSTCITVAYALALGLRIFQHRIPILREFPGTDWTHAQVGRPELAVPLLAFLLIWGSYIRRSGLYRNGVSYKASAFIPVYVKGLLFGVLSAAAILFGLKMAISRLLFGYFFILCFVLLLSKQFAFSFLYRRLRSSDSRRRHALVIGSGISAAWFSKVISAAEENGYSLIGLLFPDDAIYADTGGIPLVGTIGDLDRVLVDHPVDEVFIVGSGSEIAEMAPVAETLIHRGRVVSLISTMASSSRGIRGRVTEYAGIPMISYGPMPKDTVQSGTKRLMDVVFASIALVVLSPLLLLIAGAIKVFDPGPVFFQQDRLGHGGKHFKLYKFRSMKKNAENILNANKELYKRYVENDYKLPENEDPRISTLGRLLRKSSLDELPQLWNVLKRRK